MFIANIVSELFIQFQESKFSAIRDNYNNGTDFSDLRVQYNLKTLGGKIVETNLLSID